MTKNNKTKVAHYWIIEHNHDQWRQWLPSHLWIRATNQPTIYGFIVDLNKRKIWFSNQSDHLRWGNSTLGMFSTKESYSFVAKHHQLSKSPIWNKIWNQKLWPKVSTFLWLLTLNKSLTRDNLCKHNFSGPSRFPLCLLQEESIENLFNACH
jgi:hypothetical protein